MLYSMQMLPAACCGGTMGDVGERTAKPKNMNVRISIWRSLRSAENTTTTCSQCSLSSAASRSETKASRDPSGSMHGGNATKSVCRGARRPIGRLGCGMSAATAAVRPWSAQGHQDHHRGPAPRDMDEGFEAMTLSVPRCCCFALNISNLLSFFISTGMASKK